MKRLPILLFVFSLGLFLLGSCSASRQAKIISPYQKALQAYYQGLDSRNYDEVLKRVNDILQANPGDLEARTLRSQILFLQYRENPDDGARLRLVADLRALYRALQAGPGSSDWVRPRLYVTTGDLLLFDGYRMLQSLEATEGSLDLTFWEAYTHVFGARSFYSYAYSLASAGGEGSSRGLLRELENAQDGLVRSYAGLIECASLIDAVEKFPLIQQRRREALDQLEQLINGASPPDESPHSSMLTLEASDHSIAAGFYRLQTTQRLQTLQQACQGDGAVDRSPDELWSEMSHSAERAAFHRMMESLLKGQKLSDYQVSVQLLDRLMKQEEACP